MYPQYTILTMYITGCLYTGIPKNRAHNSSIYRWILIINSLYTKLNGCE
jgi:hypothetical protein